MTSARQLKVLQGAKDRMQELEASHIFCCICACINFHLTADEKLEYTESLSLLNMSVFFFGDSLLKYRPQGKMLGDYWWELDEAGKEMRLLVLDEMIDEIKDILLI